MDSDKNRIWIFVAVEVLTDGRLRPRTGMAKASKDDPRRPSRAVAGARIFSLIPRYWEFPLLFYEFL